MVETGYATISVVNGDCDDDELDTTHIHTHVSMKESYFNKLLEHSGNNLENK